MKLLAELAFVPDAARAARFVCALAIDGLEGGGRVFEGTCEGRIRHAPIGTNGFGFDPIFVPSGDTRTFAEMSRDEKAALSHRGRAVAALARFLASAVLG